MVEKWKLAVWEARALVEGGDPWLGGEFVPVMVSEGQMRAEWPRFTDLHPVRVPTDVEFYFAGELVWVKPVPAMPDDKVKRGGVFSVTFPFTFDHDEGR